MQTYLAVNRYIEEQVVMNMTKDVEESKVNNQDNPTEVWRQINWKLIQKKVFKLQKDIYKASVSGDIQEVRKLQKRLIRSYKARLLAVRQVSQDNRGKRTAGVDGIKSLTPKQRLELAGQLKITGKAKPTRRVNIPKPNGETRPLGIPTIQDRALQALVKMAIEPEWEAKFEPNSYGFRPARRCQDAIQQIKLCIQHKDKYVLDADIAKCFDKIDHQRLLQKTNLKGGLRKQIKSWLKSGVMDDGVFLETEAGTPQGGVISPLLANIALHGMEETVRKCTNRSKVAQTALNFIRYADDFVVMHKDKEMILKCKEAVKKFLEDMGLELKPEKTRITHTLKPELSEDNEAGFDFLGFHIQQHKAGKHKCGKNLQRKLTGFITLITPNKKSCKKHQESLSKVIRTSISKSIRILIKRLNPIINGWINYYQYSDIKTTHISSKQDTLLYNKLRSWGKRSCGTVKDGLDRYYHNRTFTDQNGKTRKRKDWCDKPNDHSFIYRHDDKHCSSTEYVKIKGNKSPFDGDLKYWIKRLQTHPELTTRQLNLIKAQKGKCKWCGEHFMDGDILEVDHIIPRSAGGKDRYDNLQLLHAHCHDQKTNNDHKNPEIQKTIKAKQNGKSHKSKPRPTEKHGLLGQKSQ